MFPMDPNTLSRNSSPRLDSNCPESDQARQTREIHEIMMLLEPVHDF